MARGPKEKTYEQAEAAQTKAVRFLRDVVGDDEKADEIESLSVEEYADRKNFQLTNPARGPQPTGRSNTMSTIYIKNPASGEETEVDLTTLPPREVLTHAVGMRESLNTWEQGGERIADAVIDFEEGNLSGQELADEVWAVLSEIDPEEYEPEEASEAEEGRE